MKKRGLSSVLATVLITLLAILAIILVWIYLSSTITESSQRAELQERCFARSAELLDCEYGGPINAGGTNPYYSFVTGLVKLNTGDSSQIRVVFYSTDGKSQSKDLEPINVLETKKVLPPTKLVSTSASIVPDYAIATPIVTNDDKTKSLVCPVSKKIFCKKTTITGDLCNIPTSIEDIEVFIAALDNQNYDQNYPDCDRINADFNCDNQVNFNDIDPFISILDNGWILCNRQMICIYLSQNQPSVDWWLDTNTISALNDMCR